MNPLKNFWAVCGSARAQSTNLNLIHAIAGLYSGKINFIIYNQLSELPHFNPDNDNENVSSRVPDFRNQIREAHGVLICTSEYAMGLTGTLKNALDWTVSSGELKLYWSNTLDKLKSVL